MKKVFIIHGFEGAPNGGWRPWLMGELAKRGIYACALSMPDPDKPSRIEWIAEIADHAGRDPRDEVYLVGHSLGSAAILWYAMRPPEGTRIAGAVLVSGPCEPTGNEKIAGFLSAPFDYAAIRSNIGRSAVIHGDDDPLVPLAQAEKMSRSLEAKLTVVKNGGHLNGSSGWYTLPEALGELLAMMEPAARQIEIST